MPRRRRPAGGPESPDLDQLGSDRRPDAEVGHQLAEELLAVRDGHRRVDHRSDERCRPDRVLVGLARDGDRLAHRLDPRRRLAEPPLGLSAGAERSRDGARCIHRLELGEGGVRLEDRLALVHVVGRVLRHRAEEQEPRPDLDGPRPELGGEVRPLREQAAELLPLKPAAASSTSAAARSVLRSGSKARALSRRKRARRGSPIASARRPAAAR